MQVVLQDLRFAFGQIIPSHACAPARKTKKARRPSAAHFSLPKPLFQLAARVARFSAARN
jgi:hypothetical protein